MSLAKITTAPGLQSLLHISVKTATVHFYSDLTGMVVRDPASRL
jgi:hypothetical protein